MKLGFGVTKDYNLLTYNTWNNTFTIIFYPQTIMAMNITITKERWDGALIPHPLTHTSSHPLPACHSFL